MEVCGTVQSLKMWIGAHSIKERLIEARSTRTHPPQSAEWLGVDRPGRDAPLTHGDAAGLRSGSWSSHDQFASRNSATHKPLLLLPSETVSHVPPGLQLTMEGLSWTDCMHGGNRSVQAAGRQALCRVEGSLQGVPVTLLRVAARESGCQLAIAEGKREAVSLCSTIAVDFWNLAKVRGMRGIKGARSSSGQSLLHRRAPPVRTDASHELLTEDSFLCRWMWMLLWSE